MNKETSFLNVVNVMGIAFIFIIGIALLIVVGYWFFYRISINKCLHSDIPKKHIPPKNIIIVILCILLIFSMSFSVQTIVQDNKNQKTINEFFNYSFENVRGSAFDSLFDNENTAQASGYALSIFKENGFEICVLSGDKAQNGLIPNTIIRIRYTEQMPNPTVNNHLDFNFKFLYAKKGQADEKFIGVGTEGSYKHKYIAINFKGDYKIKIIAGLSIRENKTDTVDPFAQIIFETILI